MATTASRSGAGRTPVHLWIVGALALVWTGFGAFDFTMMNLRDPAYLAAIPPDIIDYVDALPAWAIAAWAIGTGFAFLGSGLLLLRTLGSAYAYACSLLGLSAYQFHQLLAGRPPSMNTPASLGITPAVWIVALGLLLYTLRLRTRGVLR